MNFPALGNLTLAIRTFDSNGIEHLCVFKRFNYITQVAAEATFKEFQNNNRHAMVFHDQVVARWTTLPETITLE